MCSFLKCIHFTLLWIHTSKSMSLNQHSYFMDASAADSDVADIMLSNGYLLASEKERPRTTLVKSADNDITYLLSKLSDEELIKLLNEDTKQEVYDLNDIVKVAVDGKSLLDDNKSLLSFYGSKQDDAYQVNPSFNNKRFRTIHNKHKDIDDEGLLHFNNRNKINAGNPEKTASAYFRLEDKRVEPFNTKNHIEANYAALQKINNLLYTQPQEELTDSDEGDEQREILFDVLVAQLKTLCCKRHKSPKTRDISKHSLKSLMTHKLTQNSYPDYYGPEQKSPKEFMFLIINDEIKGNGSDELISVDPESLDKNSSVLLLGPILTPMSNLQLKGVMARISNELSKPDYVPLLQQISEGTLTGHNLRLMNSLVTGPKTRRYIKPHRCNHQSPLAKVYGGPKWIICSGYLNLNTPSLYD